MYEQRRRVGITAGVRQERWGEIETLRSAYEAIQTAIVTNKQTEAEEAMQTFRRLALVSPELITADALTLVANAEAKLKLIFGKEAGAGQKGLSAPSFEQLALYGEVTPPNPFLEAPT